MHYTTNNNLFNKPAVITNIYIYTCMVDLEKPSFQKERTQRCCILRRKICLNLVIAVVLLILINGGKVKGAIGYNENG